MRVPMTGDQTLVAAPVAMIQRVASLDVLRGFCLLGILLLNIQDFSSPAGLLHDIPLDAIGQVGQSSAADRVLMMIEWLFFEGKMRAMFGMLFGAGTLLLIDRISARHGAEAAADIFHRRNMWLILFGLLHGLFIFSGDILLYYGSVALLALYPFRHVRPRRLIAIGLALSLFGSTWGVFNALGGPPAWKAAGLQEEAAAKVERHQPLTVEEAKAVADARALRAKEIADIPADTLAGKGGYAKTEPDNFHGEVGFAKLVFSSGWVLEFTGIMLVGMGLFQTGFLSARLSPSIYVLTAIVGYAISFPIILVGFAHAQRFAFSDAITLKWIFIPYGVQQIAGMLANASLVLLVVRAGVLLWLQRLLASVGRMALSNYILQSLLCRYLFAWGSPQLYGTLRFHQQFYVAAGIWAVNVVGSSLWLSRFRFGPLEWAWRSLTYWSWQPMRRATPDAAA